MLPDILDHNLKIVFCGTCEGNKPACRVLYYDSPGDKFWMTLYKVGLTPERLEPLKPGSVLSYGIGLTDLRRAPGECTGKQAFHSESLARKIMKYRPRMLCFNGKKAAKGYYQKRSIEYGWQKENIGATRVFVAPSTSGSASRYWDEKWWYLLADSVGTNVTRVDRTNYYRPDEVCRLMMTVNTRTKTAKDMTEEDFIEAIKDIELHYSLPLHIKNMFEIAKALFAYGYLYFPFCSLAIEQALKSLEATITHKYDGVGGPQVNEKGLYPGFADKIKYLYVKRHITKAQKEILHDCRQLRNMSFHPKYQQVLGHYDGALRTLARLMNEIWVGQL